LPDTRKVNHWTIRLPSHSNPLKMLSTPTAAEGRVALSLHSMLSSEQQQPPSPRSDEDANAAAKKGFQPYHSQSVPKSENLEAHATERIASGKPVTTMMLRNIPNKYTQNTLLHEINDLGFVGTYDFFYLPMDVHNRSNVGYAFINFVAPPDAEHFRRLFSNHRFQRFHSRKIGSVCTAHVQGLDENLRHFENRAVTQARNDQYRPLVLQGRRRIDFEDAVTGAKARANSGSTASGPAQTSFSRSSSEGGSTPKENPLSPEPPEVPLVQPSFVEQSFVGAGCGATAAPVREDRLRLERAIRDFLATANSQSPKKNANMAQGLTSNKATMNGSFQDSYIGLNDDITQLLSLRSMLINRLTETKTNSMVYGGAAQQADMVNQSMCFGAQKENPAYVSLSCAGPKSEQLGLDTPQVEWERQSTPRTNNLFLGATLDYNAPDDAWRLL